jgi:formyltetrahydrofolate-dependent phosphoribosylglycinamide formyltransferase
MFEKLKQHWRVNTLNLALIIITFALGGSLCGYAGRKLLALTNLDKGLFWVLLYILLITLLWPLAVLLVSIPLGQFGFFKKYIGKVFRRFGGRGKRTDDSKEQAISNKQKAMNNGQNKIKIAIFASGAGGNSQQIINYLKNSSTTKIALVVCNKPSAGVLEVAAKAGILSLLIKKERFFNGDNYINELQEQHIDFIVLAGFLWKLPEQLTKAYPKKIINIHPALLPKYGGKGMYGNYVHEAVIANKEKQSGITIHYVDELYDHGSIIFQASCVMDETDTVATLAKKIQLLEHEHYPKVIENLIRNDIQGISHQPASH